MAARDERRVDRLSSMLSALVVVAFAVALIAWFMCYRVEATVTNGARGEGQVEVHIELRDRQSGRVVETERDLSLHGHEEAHLTADVEAPRGDWVAHVSADYPPK